MSVEDIPQAPDTPLRRMISKKSATASVSDATVVSEESSGHLDNEKIFAMATQDLVTLFGLSVSISRGLFCHQRLAGILSLPQWINICDRKHKTLLCLTLMCSCMFQDSSYLEGKLSLRHIPAGTNLICQGDQVRLVNVSMSLVYVGHAAMILVCPVWL